MMQMLTTRAAAAAELFTPAEDDAARERRIHLRVKVKSLAAEAAIIRQEAARTRGLVRWGLNQHRQTVVRQAARTALLAYGLLRGASYASMEQRCLRRPDLAAVADTARRFGGDRAQIAAWVAKAEAHLQVVARTI